MKCELNKNLFVIKQIEQTKAGKAGYKSHIFISFGNIYKPLGSMNNKTPGGVYVGCVDGGPVLCNCSKKSAFIFVVFLA